MSSDKSQESDASSGRGQFFLPAEPFEHCYEIKKSEFICQLHEVLDRAAAMAVLAQAREQYPDARHHCWAYILGAPAQALSQAFNDDGEPSGTAGKPILNVLQHRNMGNTMAIVVRYFGGIKLGAGGLVRAYSQATQQAIELCPLRRFVPRQIASLDCPYDLEPVLRRFLDQHQGNVIEQQYSSSAQFKISLPKPEIPAFKTWLSHHFQINCAFED
ncbi:YigZ family protein [Pseudoteredinibacter isoporae]|uniref:Putative YigZ family protein n=1 Tax=Pseudoteredinibacter isoporae TaxID=570281 RepID=A0A7X0JUN2_9GAMM|nr:YigZ family protein [Pseudoteredinibacter isoporae]MBB6522008.1 putative YigZ family protein [Pseudoteredinibacter isoporae]NHO87544.1 YigZ family protein [Pseudoteredinibacter isoporae]NIB24125.1 YigZ family protein [Pseudoteredinibacter isoporae]